MSWQNKLENMTRKYLEGYTACHDFYHLERVRNYAMKIAEVVECDKELLLAASLLHDVGYKGHEDETKKHNIYGVKVARKWLPEVGYPTEKIATVLEIIRLHDNYIWGENAEDVKLVEALIIQDADRIDSIGAIGAARTAYFFGEHGYPIYNSRPRPDTKEVRLNHSLLDQIQREDLRKWEYMNFQVSKQISRDKYEFSQLFCKHLALELLDHHGGENET